MSLQEPVIISVQGMDAQCGQKLREITVSLQKNLASAGIQSKGAVQQALKSSPDVEYRSDLTSLYSLALAFIGSGAAVALINAMRATYDSARGANFKFSLHIDGRQIDVDVEHLKSGEVDKLTEILRRELASN